MSNKSNLYDATLEMIALLLSGNDDIVVYETEMGIKANPEHIARQYIADDSKIVFEAHAEEI